MPFDGTDWPGRRGPRPPSDNAVTVLIVLIATCLLVLPFSSAAAVDLWRAVAAALGAAR